MRRRILVLNYEFPPLGGGGATVSFELARRFAQRGFLIDVVTTWFPGLPRYESSGGTTITRVPAGRRRADRSTILEHLRYITMAFFAIRRLTRQNHYDICHCHFLIPTGILAFCVRKFFHIPYVLTAHGSDVPGHNPDKFRMAHRFTKPLLRLIIKNASAVTVPSTYLQNLIVSNILGTPLSALRVIPNGSSMEQFPKIEKKKMILSVGRMLPFKGFQDLIALFRSNAPSDWSLTLVGDGPYRAKLTSLAEGDPRITFTGWIERGDGRLPELFAEASVFASLSTQESQGIVFVEAMKAGCAIVARPTPAVLETVGEQNGLFLSTSNGTNNGMQLHSLLTDQHLVASYRERAMERAKRFDWQTILHDYLTLFESIWTQHAP